MDEIALIEALTLAFSYLKLWSTREDIEIVQKLQEVARIQEDIKELSPKEEEMNKVSNQKKQDIYSQMVKLLAIFRSMIQIIYKSLAENNEHNACCYLMRAKLITSETKVDDFNKTLTEIFYNQTEDACAKLSLIVHTTQTINSNEIYGNDRCFYSIFLDSIIKPNHILRRLAIQDDSRDGQVFREARQYAMKLLSLPKAPELSEQALKLFKFFDLTDKEVDTKNQLLDEEQRFASNPTKKVKTDLSPPVSVSWWKDKKKADKMKEPHKKLYFG